jgi:hypothetical protein
VLLPDKSGVPVVVSRGARFRDFTATPKILFEFRLNPRHHTRSLWMLNSAFRIPHSGFE